MLASDDPRSYRNPSNAHPGQAIRPLDTSANRWLKARLRLVHKGLRTRVIPEVYVEDGPAAHDLETGVPRRPEGRWETLYEVRTGRPQSTVVFTALPGGSARLQRTLDVWTALFKARALMPQVIEEDQHRA